MSQLAPLAAKADECWYLMRDEGRQRRCGEPATHRYPVAVGWFQVCEPHARKVAAENKGIHISKIQRGDAEARREA